MTFEYLLNEYQNKKSKEIYEKIKDLTTIQNNYET